MEASFNVFRHFRKLLALLILLPVVANAQLEITAQYRPRAEFRDGYRTLRTSTTTPAFAISQRTRLNLMFTNDRVKTKLVMQDVRVWGDQRQLLSVPKVGLHEAWAEVNFGKSFKMKAGRQEWVYDDHRLLGNVDWIQPARAHDALLLKFEKSGFKAHLGGAYNQAAEGLFSTAYYLNNYKVLTFLRVEKKIGDNLNISAIALMDGFTANDSSGTNFRETVGATVIYKKKPLMVRGFGYYQMGQDAAYNTLAAYMASIEASYAVSSFTFGAGYDIMSGNDNLNPNSKNNAFNTLYATNHKFYGFMDYFLNIPAHTGGAGLTDLYIKLKYAPEGKKWGVNAHAHMFALAGKVVDPNDLTQAISSGLGQEVDLFGYYKVEKWIKVVGGVSVMMPTTSMEVLKGGDSNLMPVWSWLMIDIKPQLLFLEAKK